MSRITFLIGLLMIAASLGGCFPHEAGSRLAHFDTAAPRPGDVAPDFTLKDIDGQEVSLARLVGDKPVVLQLGSHSCPVYRYRRFSMETLRKKYAGRVHFQLVYTLEAHPAGSKSPYAEGEWLTWWNRLTSVRIAQPRTPQERFDVARMSRDTLALKYPVAVDVMENRVWRDYGAASSPAFVIDRKGRIALRQVWLDPEGIDKVLERLLDERQAGLRFSTAGTGRETSTRPLETR